MLRESRVLCAPAAYKPSKRLGRYAKTQKSKQTAREGCKKARNDFEEQKKTSVPFFRSVLFFFLVLFFCSVLFFFSVLCFCYVLFFFSVLFFCSVLFFFPVLFFCSVMFFFYVLAIAAEGRGQDHLSCTLHQNVLFFCSVPLFSSVLFFCSVLLL